MLIGNCGRDPEVRRLETGAVTASFTVATTEKYKDRSGDTKEITEWHNIVCWRGLAEIAEKYVKKGTPLYVEGRLRHRSYTDKEGNLRYITEIVADSFQMLGRRPENNDSQARSEFRQPQATAPNVPNTASSAPQAAPQVNIEADEEDDLPF